MNLQELSDHFEIRQLLHRYSRGVDRGDPELIASVYHPDAADDHGTYTGLGSEFAAFVVEKMDKTGVIGQHHLTNILITLEGDLARGETYFIALNPEGATPDTTSGVRWVTGRYIDRFERRNGEWRINHRQVVIDWAQRDDDAQPWASLPSFTRGARNGQDVSSDLF